MCSAQIWPCHFVKLRNLHCGRLRWAEQDSSRFRVPRWYHHDIDNHCNSKMEDCTHCKTLKNHAQTYVTHV